VPVFLAGAVVYGLGAGLNSPTLYAWTVDLSHPERRGRGIATMYIALEVGIGLGALLAGWIFDNQPARLPWVHALSLASVLAATAYLVLVVKNTPPGSAENNALAAEAQAVASPEEVV
jgi:MFS family permease